MNSWVADGGNNGVGVGGWLGVAAGRVPPMETRAGPDSRGGSSGSGAYGAGIEGREGPRGLVGSFDMGGL